MPCIFSPLQVELIKELGSKNARLAQIYEGGLVIWIEGTNPDRFALAAHSMRQTMEILPKYVEAPRAGPKLGELVNNLTKIWVNVKSTSTWPGSPKWQGQIEEKLRQFLNSCEDFFEKSASIMPKKAARASTVIRAHNAGTVPIPAKIEAHKTVEWLLYLDFFNEVAHHGSTTEDAFNGYLQNFENFLINIFQPPTFQNRKTMMSLIQEGEKNGQ